MTSIAVAELGRKAPRFVGTVGTDFAQLRKALDRIGPVSSILVVYEAGPCGYRLARHLAEVGYTCQVVAPTKIPRRPGERVKTDRRDALKLAEHSRSGGLVPVCIPDARDEAIRDLSRAREDAVAARLKARHQLKAMLLRHGHRYTGKSSWTAAHERYLATVSFQHPAQDIAYAEYRAAVKTADERVARQTQALQLQIQDWRLRPLVEALMCLRGLSMLAATITAAELGDLHRFAHPRELMGYLGLVPSEHTSSNNRRQGAITKTGNSHVRRVLVEAAWNYRFNPRVGRYLEKRQQTQPQAIRDIAWRAQLRLSHRYRSLTRRKLQHNKICVAIARELSGFIWAIGQQVSAPDLQVAS
jgi:transposase